MNIIIAVDAFKGSLSSTEIGQIIKTFYLKKGHHVKVIPISDGGEGFVEAIAHYFDTNFIVANAIGPLQKPTQAPYVLHNNTAFIEIGNICGLTKIKNNNLNPMHTTTYGLGMMIKDALAKGASKIVLGLGGSATNDAGAGMLQALGVKFYQNKNEIKSIINGELLQSITCYDDSILKERLKNVRIEVASDVKNPLLGPKGATYTYGIQKGASSADLPILEKNIAQFARLVETKIKQSYKNIPGSGSAGGLGFSSLAFLNARLFHGIDYMIDLLEIEKSIINSDIVFVGEGKLDGQTVFGKAPQGISSLAKKHNKKVIGIFALTEDNTRLKDIDKHFVMVPKYASQELSLKKPQKILQLMLEDIDL